MDVAPEAIGSQDATAPAYKQIEAYIQDLIAGSEYGPGDRIPSERALAETLGRNRMTVRKAIERLIANGLLERNSTSGTRIPAPRVTRPMDALAASEGLRRIIQEGGGTADNKLLHFEQSHASAKVAHRLKLKEGDDIVTLRRLWTANGLPVCIETSYLPLALVPDLAAQDLMSGQSLYDLLHTRYGIGRMHGEREIGVVACTEMEARLLNLEPGTSCLLLQAQAYEDDGRPVEFMRSVNHPSLVVFKTGQATVSSPKEG